MSVSIDEKIESDCPVCKSKKVSLFMKGVFDCDFTNVLECLDCGTQYLSPKMTEEEEAKYYNDYYQKQKCRQFEKLELIDLQNTGFQHYKQYSKVYHKILNGVSHLLEIGSGTGGFVKFVSEVYPQIKITVIERCEENVKFLRSNFKNNVEVIDGIDQLGERKFDLVTGFGVFEHIRDSLGFLNQLKKHLSVKGNLVLNVPNKNHALVYAYNVSEFRKFTYMKQHYYTFTESSFESLAKQTGYSIKGFNYLQVWGLDNQLSWLRYRKPRDYQDISQLLSKQTIDSYNQDMIDLKMTDLMMVELVLVD